LKDYETETRNLRETIERLENHLAEQIKLVEEVDHFLVLNNFETKIYVLKFQLKNRKNGKINSKKKNWKPCRKVCLTSKKQSWKSSQKKG
jgi:hypothetical protein